MTILVVRRIHQAIITLGTDKVILQCPVPTKGIIKRIDLDVSLIAGAGIDVIDMTAYAIRGYQFPLADPDATTAFDTLWDNMVPKAVDIAAGAFDLDTEALDATPFWEPGEVNLNQLVGNQASDIRKIFERVQFLTFPKRPLGFVAGTPDTFLPTDHFKSVVKPNIKAKSPSYCMFGLANPSLDETTAASTTINEVQWTMMQYIDWTMEQVLVNLLGLTEAGAESPYEEATTLLIKILNRDMHLDTAGNILSVTWNVQARATFQVSVPGRFDIGNTISGGA